MTVSGEDLLPNDLFMTDLLNHNLTDPNATIIRDHHSNVDASRKRLLLDVLTLRDAIYAQLNYATKVNLLNPDVDVFICVMLPPSYEFLVAFMAIFALGAAAVPLATAVLVEEAIYFFECCGTETLITCRDSHELASTIQQDTNIAIVDIDVALSSAQSSEIPQIKVDDKVTPNPEKAGLVSFTSGSTGPPKGVLYTRRSIYLACKSFQLSWDIKPDDLFLIPTTPQWISGLAHTMAGVISGSCVELCSTVFGPSWFWNRIKECDVTLFLSSPAYHAQLATYFENYIASGPADMLDLCKNGVRKIRILTTTGAMPTSSIFQFWIGLRPGQPVVNHYGTTETIGATWKADWNKKPPIPARCVGQLMSGVTSNLGDGEEGELRLKSPHMFKKYISKDTNVMTGVFDDHGFFKTGDLARREGSNYFILGRVSQDLIRFSGWKMMAYDIEEHILQLPEVIEVMVLGVSDEECEERVAVIVRPSSHHNGRVHTFPLTLAHLRQRLSMEPSLPMYKQPTLLRILRDDERIPTTRTGKLSKVQARKQFLPDGFKRTGEVEVWDLNSDANASTKAWDWAGIGSAVDRT